MTFSIIGHCTKSGMFGVAVSSSSPAVAARCVHARAGVGAVASQNITNPALGTKVLDLMASGTSAEQALAMLASSEPDMAFRQLLAIGKGGGPAVHSGPHMLGTWAEASGKNVVCAGNLLAGPGVPQAMVDGFTATPGHLADRLLAGLNAGLAAGGEAGPVRSAGLMVVAQVPWPVVDLRVDWTEECPIQSLATLWALYRPQLDDYVTRALNPRLAPSYGVPGDS